MKTGRPEKIFNESLFKSLCGIQCTQNEIADILEMSADTLSRRCQSVFGCTFADAYKRFSAPGKVSLRRLQYALAKKSPAMAIFLGKVYLNQREAAESDESAMEFIVQ